MVRNARGFTLIELMVVLAVTAILAAVALSTYRDYVSRSKIMNAISGLAGEKIKVAEGHSVGKSGVALCDAVATNGVVCNAGTLSVGGSGLAAGDTSVQLRPDLTAGDGERISWTCTVLLSPTKRYIGSDCFDLTP